MLRSRDLRIQAFLAAALWAAASGAGAAPLAANETPAAGEKEKGPFEKLKFRSIGPAIGGRVARVAGVAGQPLVYYAATAHGGVWKSEDGGLHWKPLFDEQPVLSTGSIAVAPSDPNVIYVGSGEANIRGNVQPGIGIFRSNDAGKSWSHVWKQTGQIGEIVVHPSNPDVAWAAVLGHAFGPNPERGVYKTRDGGATWQQVLYRDADTGASSVVTELKGLNGRWAAMAGMQVAPTAMKTPLPRDFEASYDVVAAQNYRWGAKGLTFKLAKTGGAASFLSVKIRPGFDGRDGEVEIEGKFPSAPTYMNGTKWVKAPGFSNNSANNRVTVMLKKKGDLLQVFVGETKVAEYEKGVPAGLQFDALSFDLTGNSSGPAADEQMFIGNIRVSSR
jgi:hypothetical protein